MEQFNKLINSTIDKNNVDIYRNLKEFLCRGKHEIDSIVTFDENTKGLSI